MGEKALKTVEINPKRLSGDISVPPSKSVSHRAIIAAALSKGKSRIENVIMSKDIEATCKGLESLGSSIQIETAEEGRVTLTIEGSGMPNVKNGVIDCIESGSTLRFLIPLAALTGEEVTFEGRGKLVERPLDIYYDIFKSQGLEYENANGMLPLTLKGTLKAGHFKIRGDVSSQFITGLMFALPLVEGDSTIEIEGKLESVGYIDLTLDVLRKFGIKVENSGYSSFYIKGGQTYTPSDYRVEGDFSQAAFWLVAGTIGSEVNCIDVDKDSLQGDKEIVEIIKAMGGNISISGASMRAIGSSTRGISIDASQIPDIVPIISVMASLSKGTTIISNAARLRIKESDRIKSTVSELAKLGATIRELEDGIEIEGKDELEGGVVESWNDHRIAMAMAIASIRCKNPVVIKGAESVKKSYPGFWNDFRKLGGDINERDMG